MTTSLATAGGLSALAGGVALVRPAYRGTAGWFALAAVGQGAALAMIDAGHGVQYQHYERLTALAATRPWLLAIVILQAILVVTAGMPAFRRSNPFRPGGVSVWRVAVALVLSVATAATVSVDVGRYIAELAFAATLQCLAIATILLAALAWPEAATPGIEAMVSKVLGQDDVPSNPGDRRFAWTAAAVATILAAGLSVLVYERHPHVPDEVVYLHHAKYLAEGRLTLPAPPVPAAFDVDLMEYEADRWFSPVPPGWPAALAVGAFVGAPWLVNPVLAGLNVFLAFWLLKALYSSRVARAASALLAISPWFLSLGMSFMTHQLGLAAALLAAYGVVRARQSGGVAWGFAAGAGVGLTSLIRPLDGVIVGTLIGVWSLGVGGARLRLVSLAGLALGTVLVGALVFPYNRMLTGDSLVFPINAYVDKHYAPNANAYGFGPDRGMGWAIDPNPGHSPLDGLINANLNTFGINTDLMGWPTGSLVFITWLVCSGAWRRQDSVMMAGLLGFGLAYFPYYFSGGPDFGARYWFPTIVPLVALTARGIQTLERRAGPRVWLAVGLLAIMTVTTYLPWRGTDKYHHYRGMRADLRTLAADNHFGADLVLVRGERHPDYASAFAENPADLQAPVAIYAWDRDAPTRTAVLRAYLDRPVWLVDGPSVTGAGFRVVAGPVDARALLGGGR